MTISTIRRLTEEDTQRVEVAARRFADRHGIELWQGSPSADDIVIEIEYAIDNADDGERAYLRKLWTAVYCRALRVPTDVRTTTAYGHVGVSID